MISKSIIVKNRIGLHARPAALFVQTTGKFLCDIFVEKDNKRINAKSIMGIMALGVSHGDEITLTAEGEDEKEAIDALVDLIENKLNEE